MRPGSRRQGALVDDGAPASSRPGARHGWRSTQRSIDELADRFPARPIQQTWAATEASRKQCEHQLLEPPLLRDDLPYATRRQRRIGLVKVLDWLQAQPGHTWQARWMASGAEAEPGTDWRRLVTGAGVKDPNRACADLGPGLSAMICADLVRPSIRWLLTTATPRKLAASLARTRDPDGYAQLALLCQQAGASRGTTGPALDRIAVIMAAKGGVVADIGVGDCLQVLQACADTFTDGHYNSPFFYQLLHAMGIFGPTAPPTVRVFGTRGQRSPEQLIDRYGIVCRPIRDLLVDYLSERQPRLDYSTLEGLSRTLGNLFWADLERHHQGIDSLQLPGNVAAAWKQRLFTKTTTAGGQASDVSSTRLSAMDTMATVRAFYLDIGEWATEEPARWGPWVVPSPVRAGEITHRKDRDRRKSRMDQRTRARIPVLPALVAALDAERIAAAERVDTALRTPPGELFTAAGQTLRRAASVKGGHVRTWAEDPDTGARADLTLAEHRAFWAWAAVEVLFRSGIRIEELTELTHHSLVQYRLPATGELIPLLHIAPSKTDTERLLVISPELADVLSAIICRIRDEAGTVPLVVARDENERVWNAPAPLLFQRHFGAESRPITAVAIRQLINFAVAGAFVTDADKRPLKFAPHDFRRIFVTDAIMHGMPPHIAQLLVGHRNINTTMGYKAVYPKEAINAHRAFIARRRALRPAEEYRTPTDEEWEEFLGHFVRRKVSLGTCGRSYATACPHEHSCIRCPLLRPDPAQRDRLIEIGNNLQARLQEAHQQGWAGEAEGLKISLAATQQKLAHTDQITARRNAAVHLGMPAFPDIAARTVTATEPPNPGGQPS